MPHYLLQAQRMERWGMARAGGLFDQPRRLMELAETALNTYAAFSSRALAKNAVKWSESNPNWAEFCYAVDEWRERG